MRLSSLLPGLLPLVLLACSSPAPEPTGPATGSQSAPIIGGEPDNGVKAHKNVVMLFSQQGGGICTGSLIAPNLVLTARHCVSQNITEGIGCDPEGNSFNGDHVGSDLSASAIQVLNGVSPTSAIASGKKIFHPEGKNLCNNDIALLLLDQSVDIEPIKLRLDFGAQTGELTTAVGYGKTSDSDFSAGTRYRRENIPVLSVGRDYNYLLGENEFAMGQSTCQGDSGGPIMAGDTGAVLGVTSRGGDCQTGVQRFTRVDKHKALIEAALAEAGAVAQLEGKPAPAPVNLKATGEGPCVTGSECQGAYCDAASNNTCTSLCQPGFCPANFVCLPTAAVFSEQVFPDIPICQALQPADDCDSCRFSKCKVKAETCALDPDCNQVRLCVAKCTTSACFDDCAASNSKGAALYDEVRSCECSKCTKSCATVCADPSGTGGSGGSGGSSAGAGGTDAGAGGSDAGAGGSDAGAGGSEAGAGGSEAGGEGGSDPQGGEGGTDPQGGEGGADPQGEGGSDAGTGGSDAAGAGGSGVAGTGGSVSGAAGQASAGAGGAGAGGAAGTAQGSPAAQPAGDAGDSGGCSASGQARGGAAWALALGLAAVAGRRRKQRA